MPDDPVIRAIYHRHPGGPEHRAAEALKRVAGPGGARGLKTAESGLQKLRGRLQAVAQ